MKIAICVIAYNRIDSIKRLLNSLSKAYYQEDVTLIISIDKSNSDIVGKISNSFIWEFGDKRVIAHSSNLGLKKHILSIGNYFNEFDAIVVLEDDITVAPNFYNYTKQAVEKYTSDKSVAGIALYNYPQCIHKWLPFKPVHSDSDVYLMQVAVSWGQVWMKKQWEDFIQWYNNNEDDFSFQPHLPKTICSWGKQSWLKYHMKYCIEENKYFVFPYISLATNNSDQGIHNSHKLTIFQTELLFGEKLVYKFNPIVKYDAFFENKQLATFFNISEKDLCVDYYGYKQNLQGSRYWLTRSLCNYRIVAQYSLEQKPYEYNIYNNIEGNDLFLYDTKIKERNPYKSFKRKFIQNKNYIEYLFGFKLLSLIKNYVKMIFNKQ